MEVAPSAIEAAPFAIRRQSSRKMHFLHVNSPKKPLNLQLGVICYFVYLAHCAIR